MFRFKFMFRFKGVEKAPKRSNTRELLRTTRYCKRAWIADRQLQAMTGDASPWANLTLFSQVLLLIRLLGLLPMFVNSRCRVYLESGGSDASKVGVAAAELRSAFRDSRALYEHRWPTSLLPWVKVIRILFRAPRALFYAVYLRCRARRASSDIDVLMTLVALDVYIRFFERHPRLFPLIISDVGPVRYLLGRAAAVAKNPGIWYQQDIHHSWEPPVPVGAGIVWTLEGAKALRAYSESLTLYRRPSAPRKKLKLERDYQNVGVAVNALFRISDNVLKVLDDLRMLVGADTLYIRLHPRSPPLEKKRIPAWCRIAPGGETAEEFLGRVDLLIVGNTAFMILALAYGLPVIHVEHLDPLIFDAYGYVEKGIVYGVQHPSGDMIADMNVFYSGQKPFEKLGELIALPETAAPLSALLTDLKS